MTWEDSIVLKQMFEDKFQKIRNQNLSRFASSDCLEVLSLAGACEKYGVDSMPNTNTFSKDWFSSKIFTTRTKPDLLNDLCLKLQGELKIVLGERIWKDYSWNTVVCIICSLEFFYCIKKGHGFDKSTKS